MGEIVVYGREACGMCARFKADCVKEGLTTRLVNIDTDEGSKEMFERAEVCAGFRRTLTGAQC